LFYEFRDLVLIESNICPTTTYYVTISVGAAARRVGNFLGMLTFLT